MLRTRVLRGLVILSLAGFLLPACTGDNLGPGLPPEAPPPPPPAPPPPPPADVSFMDDVQPVFTQSCAVAGCHIGAGAPQGMDLSLGVAFGMIVNVPSGELPSMDRVEPGDKENSYLFHKISGTQASVGGSGSQMPLAGCCLAQDVIVMIGAWIDQGAEDN